MPGTPDVIRGRDGWLFLREGTNHSYSYLTGATPVLAKTAWQWRKAILRRNALFANCLHLICPEKLAVFADQVEGVTLDDQRLALRLAALDRVVYPLEALRAARFGDACSYPKGDTHFNDLGAFAAARAVLDAFGIDAAFDPEWKLHLTGGDLANKVDPPERSETVGLAKRMPLEFQDNRISNRGRVIHFRNTGSDPAIAGRRLLIFGDSFSAGNLARILTFAFAEILFVHSLSADYRMVSRFAPTHILFELAERFLRHEPSDGLSIESTLIHKCHDGQQQAVRDWRDDHGNHTRTFVDWSVVEAHLAA